MDFNPKGGISSFLKVPNCKTYDQVILYTYLTNLCELAYTNFNTYGARCNLLASLSPVRCKFVLFAFPKIGQHDNANAAINIGKRHFNLGI